MLYKNHSCWKQDSFPNNKKLYPIFPDNSGGKIVINLLPVHVPALLQTVLCSQPWPGNVLHQLQLFVPPQAAVAALHPLV